jgi:hypothetical protein
LSKERAVFERFRRRVPFLTEGAIFRNTGLIEACTAIALLAFRLLGPLLHAHANPREIEAPPA